MAVKEKWLAAVARNLLEMSGEQVEEREYSEQEARRSSDK